MYGFIIHSEGVPVVVYMPPNIDGLLIYDQRGNMTERPAKPDDFDPRGLESDPEWDRVAKMGKYKLDLAVRAAYTFAKATP